MSSIDTLTQNQREQLLEIQNDYIDLLKTNTSDKYLQRRIKEIDDALAEHEKPIKPNYFG